MNEYYWDFYGPRSAGTAAHFRAHLEQFLATAALAGCHTAVLAHAGGQHSVQCIAPPDAGAALTRALRPQRMAAAPTAPSAPQAAG